MKSQIINTLACTIAWLERIEKEEPRVTPIINELAKIKLDHTTPDLSQIPLPIELGMHVITKCQ